MEKTLRVGLAYNAFSSSFAPHFPGMTLVSGLADVAKYDLIIFSGGEDINPRLYGEQATHTFSFSDTRDMTEKAIFERAYSLKKKILGVCRGHQLANVVLGGSLWQDIYLEHGSAHPGSHTLEKVCNHPVMDTLPNEVNSYHHQGVKSPGGHMVTIAGYRDVSEVAINLENTVLTVQFHPEFMSLVPFFEYIKNVWVPDRNSLSCERVKMRLDRLGQKEDLFENEMEGGEDGEQPSSPEIRTTTTGRASNIRIPRPTSSPSYRAGVASSTTSSTSTISSTGASSSIFDFTDFNPIERS